MTFEELLQAGKFEDAIKLLKAKDKVADYAAEYKENKRDLRATQVGKRVDKKLKNKTVQVAKIPIPFPVDIVQSAVAFLFGEPLKITSNLTKIQDILDTWEDMRLDSLLIKFCETVKSETEAALVFYSKGEGEDLKLKARMLSSKNGELLPVFDAYGDLVSFGWKFKDTDLEDGKEKEFLHLWTAEQYFVLKNDQGWQVTEESGANLFGKIPVVYMPQDEPEWYLVKELIDRFEMNLSRFADTNDYFSSPSYKAKGAVGQLPDKDETGKIITLPIIETESGKIIEADLDVISWDRAPEALELEFKIERSLIYGLTKTADLSQESLKGLGANLSGIALQMMFFGSILKSKFNQGDYKIAIKRILQVIMAGMVNITKQLSEADIKEAKFDIEFTSVLPDNLMDVVNILSTATGGKPIMSRATAVKNNPIVEDADAELDQIAEEEKESSFNLTE